MALAHLAVMRLQLGSSAHCPAPPAAYHPAPRLPAQVEEKFETGGKMTEQEVIDSLRQVRVGVC